jgi:protocatechuate 3,4-dioxygenase beta subunit
MNRKAFIKLLGAVPLLGIPFKGMSNQNDCKTQKDAEGPFYKRHAPSRSVIETEGQPLHIEGRVFKAGDCQSPISGAVIDVWHCDAHGEYDMDGFKGRGQIKTDQSGSYRFTTIYPPPYGSRPRHIHFKIKVEGQPELTTQLYFEGDPNIKNDFARNAEENRVIRLRSEKDLKKGVFNIYV